MKFINATLPAEYNSGRILKNSSWYFGGITRGRSTKDLIEFVEKGNRVAFGGNLQNN